MDAFAGVVTGAGGNVGVAVCRRLGKRGANVIAVDVSEEAAARGAQACIAAGGTAEAMVADVTQEASVMAYAQRAVSLWWQAAFFFNNAGIEGSEAPLLSYPADAWDRALAVNLRGVFLGLKALAGPLRHADVARIVNTASVAGLCATPMLAAYGASKHAVIGLTKTAAVEFAPFGISVNALCPGPIESDMMRRIEAGVSHGEAEAAHRAYEQNVPMHRYATLDEVADLAVYLLLDAPIYLTGQAIALDGGMSAV
jgi:NAD(P)-dependent dehydrogenase (short-subunit alcohol dehydrogenase family)